MSESSPNRELTMVYYYIPEDYDDPNMPNCFAIPKPVANIHLQDIEQYFPLNLKPQEGVVRTQPKSSSQNGFLFRFKYKIQGQNAWLDLNN